jgi:hypothetical protein
LFEDKKCPNVKCCIEKGFDGCYECQDLSNCHFEFYESKEQVAKATAIFIQKHGKNQYDISLTRAIRNGIKYPNQFNELEDVYKMVAFLEKYL